jgi:hypothetical protein
MHEIAAGTFEETVDSLIVDYDRRSAGGETNEIPLEKATLGIMCIVLSTENCAFESLLTVMMSGGLPEDDAMLNDLRALVRDYVWGGRLLQHAAIKARSVDALRQLQIESSEI